MKEADIFSEALDRPVAEREEFLREACGGDVSLLKKVRILLDIHEEDGGLLDEPVGELDDFPESKEEHELPSSREMLNKDGTQILYFGEYRLEGEIARGAMGVVYRAFQNSLKRIVAVKMIRSNMLASEDDVARFRTEAEAAGSLDHPNIVPIYEVGEFQGQHYFSMKLIEGGTLRDHLANLQKNSKATAALMIKVAGAIQTAHQRGVLHRDLKPGNILIDTEGEPHVTDFGLAKQMDSVSSATLSGQLLGTPSYMAPEQAEGGARNVTTAADIYGLGAIFYEILAGVPPHKGESLMETLKFVAEAEVTNPSRYNPSVDRDLQTIAMKCLERDPAARFPSAKDLADDLARWLRGEPIEARPSGEFERALKWVKRKPVHAVAAGLGILLLLILGIGGPLAAIHQRTLKDEAIDARNIASEHAESLRRQMYSFEMISASEAAVTPSGIPKIDRWIPTHDSKEADLRDWEWFYARSVTEQHVASYNTDRKNPIISWSEKSGQLLVLDGRNQLSELDVETGCIMRRWSVPSNTKSFGVIRGTDQIRMRCGNRLIRRSLQTSEEELMFDIPPIDIHCSWSPDSRFMASLQPRNPPRKNHSALRMWIAGEDWARAPFIEIVGADSSPQAWSSDGDRLAIANSPFGDLRMFDPTAGNHQMAQANVMGRLTVLESLVWSPNDDMIALTTQDGQIKVVTTEDLTVLEGWGEIYQAGKVGALAWSPDGSRLASGGDDRIVRVREVASGREILAFRGHTDSITTLAWSPDGRWIASGERGGEIRIWNAHEDSRPVNIQSTPLISVNTVSWHPEGERIAIAANQEWAYSGSVLELPSRRIRPNPGNLVKCLDWDPSGKRLAVGRLDGGSDFLQVFEIGNDKPLWEAGPGSWQVAWAPDGEILAAMLGHGDLILHLGEDGSVLRTIKALSKGQRVVNPTRQFQFSPSGRTLAWGQKSGDLALFDPTTGELQGEIEGHTARVAGVDWTGDSTRIATASEDHTARIWNAASGEPLQELIGHSASVIDLRWSPDESRLATASLDGTVRLWDPATGSEVARYQCPSAMRAVDWSPDGTRLIAGGKAGLFLFDARPGMRVEALGSFHQYAKNGEWNVAATVAREILKRFSSQSQSGWLQTGWWSRKGTEVTPVGAGASGWEMNGEGVSGSRIDLDGMFGAQGDQAAWLMTRVFSPCEQSVQVHLSSPGQAQLWKEEQLVFEIEELDASYSAKTGELTLQEGWNTLTLRPFRWEAGDLMNLTLFR
jgi:serine/threonine protein kinase/WD40 repeat protein